MILLVLNNADMGGDGTYRYQLPETTQLRELRCIYHVVNQLPATNGQSNNDYFTFQLQGSLANVDWMCTDLIPGAKLPISGPYTAIRWGDEGLLLTSQTAGQGGVRNLQFKLLDASGNNLTFTTASFWLKIYV